MWTKILISSILLFSITTCIISKLSIPNSMLGFHLCVFKLINVYFYPFIRYIVKYIIITNFPEYMAQMIKYTVFRYNIFLSISLFSYLTVISVFFEYLYMITCTFFIIFKNYKKYIFCLELSKQSSTHKQNYGLGLGPG